MWSLDEFRFDDAIPGSEVFVFDEDHGELVSMTNAEAIQLARSRDMALFAQWPAFPDEEDVSCAIGKLTLPIRWEQLSEAVGAEELDENLWFEAECGGRDILTGNSHTFTGRISAWCQRRDFAAPGVGTDGGARATNVDASCFPTAPLISATSTGHRRNRRARRSRDISTQRRARGGIRTRKPLRTKGFKPSASTSSATRARTVGAPTVVVGTDRVRRYGGGER